MERRLYILAGCNGAGKTTVALEILPEILQCETFINADNIAFQLSPFHPESVAINAGRIMVNEIQDLLNKGESFAFETTLAAKCYKSLIGKAKNLDYEVTLIFMWLNSAELAIKRVAFRVQEGGHNIPEETIKRRYIAGIRNLFQIYLPIVDNFMIFDSTESIPTAIAHKFKNQPIFINNLSTWKQLNKGK